MFRYLDEHYHKVHLPDAVLSMLKKSDARNRTAELVDGIVPLVVPGQSRTKTSALGGFGSIIWSFAFDSPLQQFSLETPDAIKRRNELLRKLTRGSRQVARALSELPTLEGFGRALVVAPYPDVRYIELRKEAPRDP